MTFTERAPIEEGFAPVFADRIAPELDRLEAERLAHAGQARRGMIWPVGIAAVLFGAFALFGWNLVVGGIVAVVIGGIAALVIRGRHAGAWQQKIGDAVFPVVCEFLGDCRFDRRAEAGFSLAPLKELKILPAYDSATIRDRLEGSYRDTAFEIVELTLTSRSTNGTNNSSTTTTEFHGLLMRIGVPVAVPTRIAILRDWGGMGNTLAGMFSGGKGRGMPRVEVDHAAFDAAFEVHADDPGAARAFLPPLLLDALLRIGEEEGGRKGAKGMRAGFDDGAFFLALDRRTGFMDLGALGRSAHEVEPEIHKLFEDMAIVRRIIDRLHGDEPHW